MENSLTIFDKLSIMTRSILNKYNHVRVFMAAEEKKQKKKLPTAQKRILQDQKKQLVNRMFKSRIRTAMRSFEESLKEKNAENLTKDLNSVYSLVDKAVKKNIYKVNKAKRIKSRHAHIMQQTLAS